MRLIDADRLLDRCKFYHLPNGDLAIPIIDVQHAPTIELPDINVGNIDAISRKAVMELWDKYHYTIAVNAMEFDAELRQLPSAQPYTTTHDSIPAETGKNDGDGTSGDCVSRQAAIDFVGSMNMCDEISNEACKKLTSYLDELPSMQPDIIFCPDCCYNDGTAYCELHYRDVKAKDFCSWAERREDATD